MHKKDPYNNCLAVEHRVKEAYVDPISVILHGLGGDLEDGVSSFPPCTLIRHLGEMVTKNRRGERRVHIQNLSHQQRMRYDIY